MLEMVLHLLLPPPSFIPIVIRVLKETDVEVGGTDPGEGGVDIIDDLRGVVVGRRRSGEGGGGCSSSSSGGSSSRRRRGGEEGDYGVCNIEPIREQSK